MPEPCDQPTKNEHRGVWVSHSAQVRSFEFEKNKNLQGFVSASSSMRSKMPTLCILVYFLKFPGTRVQVIIKCLVTAT